MNWPEIPDRELIDLCLRRDEAAWREFLRRFQPIILGVANNTFRYWEHESQMETRLEDFLQEVLLKLLADDMRALRHFKWTHENAFRAFLKVVTAALAADAMRRCLSGKQYRSRNTY